VAFIFIEIPNDEQAAFYIYFLNELMILTQPGILQQFVGNQLTPEERDIRRASLIREKLSSKNN